MGSKTKQKSHQKKKRRFCLAFSKQQVVDFCKAQALKLQMLKAKCSGLDLNIIYKAQISLFTRLLERNAVNRVAAAAAAAQVSVTNPPFVSICLGCLLLLLLGACSSNEHNVFFVLVFGFKMQTGH